MRKFMDRDFLLSTPTAKWLYHEAAEKMPIPRRKQRGIKLETPQGTGYLTLAAFANCPCKHGRLAHCSRE